MTQPTKECMKRLMRDLEEIKKYPAGNLSAACLDDNILEWHCNIRHREIIYHLILFFPPNYPYKAPSAEFVPRGFNYKAGAVKLGRKGTQICLSIFSDFSDVHGEWAKEKGNGWSPAYTVQAILLNVVAFLAEIHDELENANAFLANLSLAKNFTCADCGHCYGSPFPELLDSIETSSEEKKDLEGQPLPEKPQIIDYISKDVFKYDDFNPDEENLFGFGLIVSHRGLLTTPCEFLTSSSFYDMKEEMQVVHSVLKEELKYFLPLYIYVKHGSFIRKEFEKTMMKISHDVLIPRVSGVSIEEIALVIFPNLMCSTVVNYCNKTQHTSENNLKGYFALHRLFLWALDTYPNLQAKVECALKNFVEDEYKRNKLACPDIGQWLMLLAGSKQFKWRDVAEAYLCENARRNVMWYLKKNPVLANISIDQTYRLDHTFKETLVSRNLLAFQVVFLDIALPKEMSRSEIIKRYDDNSGLPTQDMLDKMQEECDKINNQLHTYADWYRMLKLPVPSDTEIFHNLVDAVNYALTTRGYHDLRR